jgi:hypothetical protein
VEVGKACGGPSGGNGWRMVAAHGDPWFTREKERWRGRWELGVLAAGELAVQLERSQATGVAEQKGQGDKASSRGNYCGSEVAAGGCSGRPWRAHGRTARREKRSRAWRGRRVGGSEAGGGRRRSAQRRPEGKLHRRQSRRSRGAEDRGGLEEEEEREEVWRTGL